MEDTHQIQITRMIFKKTKMKMKREPNLFFLFSLIFKIENGFQNLETNGPDDYDYGVVLTAWMMNVMIVDSG